MSKKDDVLTKPDRPKKMKRKAYEAELARLEVELVKLQGWIKQKGLKVAVIFEGRDSAGKGGATRTGPVKRPFRSGRSSRGRGPSGV